VGILLTRAPDHLLIFDVRPGSPAAERGIRPGEHLLAIGDRDVRSYGFRGAGSLLIGPDGTGVTVMVQRPGHAPRSVELVRAPY
jgi:C-terminal processing protease CtpA/Prc